MVRLISKQLEIFEHGAFRGQRWSFDIAHMSKHINRTTLENGKQHPEIESGINTGRCKEACVSGALRRLSLSCIGADFGPTVVLLILLNSILVLCGNSTAIIPYHSGS